jgi:CRP/FNR family transcriptional regulator, anaerobic regulatory protein
MHDASAFQCVIELILTKYEQAHNVYADTMNTDKLFEILSATHFLSADLREDLKTELEPVTFRKSHYLIQSQTAAHHAFFLDTGFAVGFRYRQSRRVVTDFWQPGDIIITPKSFFQQLPTDEIVQLTTDSQLFSLSYNSACRLVEKYPAANSLARDISADYNARNQERILDLHTLDTWQRYLKMLSAYPSIELNVSQELIASYLNVTPQSLSRLKGEHHKP